MQAVKEKLNDMTTVKQRTTGAKAAEQEEKELAKSRVGIAKEIRKAKEAEAAMDLHVAKAGELAQKEMHKHPELSAQYHESHPNDGGGLVGVLGSIGSRSDKGPSMGMDMSTDSGKDTSIGGAGSRSGSGISGMGMSKGLSKDTSIGISSADSGMGMNKGFGTDTNMGMDTTTGIRKGTDSGSGAIGGRSMSSGMGAVGGGYENYDKYHTGGVAEKFDCVNDKDYFSHENQKRHGRDQSADVSGVSKEGYVEPVVDPAEVPATNNQYI